MTVRNFPTFSCLSLLLLVASGGCGGHRVGTTGTPPVAPPTDPFFSYVAPLALGGPGIVYPHGSTLLYTGYQGDPVRDVLEVNGFSATGPFYTNQQTARLPVAATRNIPALAQIDGVLEDRSGDGRITAEDVPYFSESEVRTLVRAQVQALAGQANIQMWLVKPEELRPFSPADLRFLEWITDEIRRNDPLKRPIYHYNPNHRSQADLETVGKALDVLGKGNYCEDTGHTLHRAWVRFGMDQVVAAAKALGKVPVLCPQMSRHPGESNLAWIPSFARHDVYLGLVRGAKGVVIWSLATRPEFTTPAGVNTYQAWYDAYAGIGKELLHPLPGAIPLGQVFLQGSTRNSLAVVPQQARNPFPDPSSTPAYAGQTLYPWSSAEYAHGTDRYLFVVNSWGEDTSFLVTGFPGTETALRDAFTGLPLAQEAPGQLRLALKPWGVAAVRFSPR